jgi:cytochrome c5
MASFGSRARTRNTALLLGLLGLLAAGGACTTTQNSAPAPAPAPAVEPQAPPQAFEAGVELPAGRGREILIASCLGCHELTTLPLFAQFYTRDSWRTLVLTMKEHGAAVDGAEIEVLTEYLARHFGRDAP